MKILIIDPDENFASSTKDCLAPYNYDCDIITDDTNGLSMALSHDYICIILETKLAKRDGFYVCREIRKVKKIPIIFISSLVGEAEKVRAFAVGADDYICKPFSLSETTARINAHINRYISLTDDLSKQNSNIIKIRNLKINKDSHRVYLSDKEINFPVKEYELLLFLSENPNIVFSKEHLLDRVWGLESMGDSSTVTVHIQRIREKIENTDDSSYIETVWGAGYRMST